MSLAVSNNIDAKSISWNNNSLINNNSDWDITGGEAVISDTIILGSNSEINLKLDCQGKNYKANYLKILTHLSCDDKTLTTDNVHNICVLCEVVYMVETDGVINRETVVYEYYPKYDFEETYKEDFTIVQAINSNIASIDITILNYEQIPVMISNTGLFMSSVVDEGTIDNVVNNSMESNYGKRMSCIDVRDTRPDPTLVPNGVNAPYCYMWILRSALE